MFEIQTLIAKPKFVDNVITYNIHHILIYIISSSDVEISWNFVNLDRSADWRKKSMIFVAETLSEKILWSILSVPREGANRARRE